QNKSFELSKSAHLEPKREASLFSLPPPLLHDPIFLLCWLGGEKGIFILVSLLEQSLRDSEQRFSSSMRNGSELHGGVGAELHDHTACRGLCRHARCAYGAGGFGGGVEGEEGGLEGGGGEFLTVLLMSCDNEQHPLTLSKDRSVDSEQQSVVGRGEARVVPQYPIKPCRGSRQTSRQTLVVSVYSTSSEAKLHPASRQSKVERLYRIKPPPQGHRFNHQFMELDFAEPIVAAPT
ncbi:hypothetical protein KUDE01_016504, partial [Dissostichus eleginoides]